MMMTSFMVMGSVLWMEGWAWRAIKSDLSTRDSERRVRLAAMRSANHDAGHDGLVQPARGPDHEHGCLVAPPRHDTGVAGLQGVNPGPHHGSRSHCQQLQH